MTTTTDTTMRRLIFEQQPKRKAKEPEGVVLCCRTGGVLELEGDDFVSQLPRCLLRRSVLVVVAEASRRVGVSAVLGIADVVGALLGDAVLLRAFFDVAQGPLVLDLFFLLPVTVVFVVLVAILRHSLLLL